VEQVDAIEEPEEACEAAKASWTRTTRTNSQRMKDYVCCQAFSAMRVYFVFSCSTYNIRGVTKILIIF